MAAKSVKWCNCVKQFCSSIPTPAAAKSLQSCPTLCDPIDGSPPGSPVPGILQARTLEWVAISFSSAWKWQVKAKLLSRVRLFATPWTAAYQAPPSMGFSRQEYWSGVPYLPQDPAIPLLYLSKRKEDLWPQATCTRIITVTSFAAAKIWKESICWSTGDLINCDRVTPGNAPRHKGERVTDLCCNLDESPIY